jgi:hypothetical protein
MYLDRLMDEGEALEWADLRGRGDAADRRMQEWRWKPAGRLYTLGRRRRPDAPSTARVIRLVTEYLSRRTIRGV